MLSVMMEDEWGPILTVCGRFDRKSFIQLQIDEERPRVSSLFIRMSGNDCIKSGTIVYEEHPDVAVSLFQMA